MHFSFIIPCYNVENRLDDCLDSILNQKSGAFSYEIILIDDCSTDKTKSLIKKYEESFPNISGIYLDTNSRQGTARNIALKQATGDYACFVDSDDWIRRDYLLVLSTVIEATNHPEIIQFRHNKECQYSSFDEPLELSNISQLTISDVQTRKQLLLSSDYMDESCWRKIYKRTFIEENNASFAERVTYEEPLFTFPLKLSVSNLVLVDHPLYYYRFNPEGVTASYMQNPNTIMDHLDAQIQTLLFCRNIDKNNIYKDEIELYFIHNFLTGSVEFLELRHLDMPDYIRTFIHEKLVELVPEAIANPYLGHKSLEKDTSLLAQFLDSKNI